jgi:hypothetical protein
VLAHGHKVEYAPKVDSQQVPERKDCIMENLVVPVEQ